MNMLQVKPRVFVVIKQSILLYGNIDILKFITQMIEL